MRIISFIILIFLIAIPYGLTANPAIIWGSDGYAENLAPTGIKFKSGNSIDDESSSILSTEGDFVVGAGTSKEFDAIESFFRARSTGMASPTTLTQNSGDNTLFDIGAVAGQIADFPNDTYYKIDFAGQTGITPIAPTSGISYVFIDNTGSVAQQTTEPTPEDRRQKIFVGRVITNASSVVTQTIVNPVVTENIANSLYDLFDALGTFNDNGNIITANGSNLNLNKSAGKIFDSGANYGTDREDPHRVTISACTTCSFFYNTQTGLSVSGVTAIVPASYDNAGTITAISGSNNRASNHRVFLFPSGNLTVQYGQTVYNTLAEAAQNVDNESYIVNPNFVGGVLIAVISVRKGATDLSLSTDAIFTYPNQFGGNAGTAGGISTLQGAYENTPDATITLNSTNGGINILDASSPILAPFFSVLSNDELTTYLSVSQGEVVTETDLNMNGTGQFKFPAGTTAQRPTPSNFSTRGNTTIPCLEQYDSGAGEWVCMANYADIDNVESNFIYDGSFEKEVLAPDVTVGLTVGYASYTEDEELYTPYNKKYYEISGVGLVNEDLYVRDTLARANMDDKAGLYALKYKITSTTDEVIQFCLRVDDSSFATSCPSEYTVNLIADGTWRSVNSSSGIPFIFGSTSVEWEIFDEDYTGTILIGIDKVRIGDLPDGYIQSINNVDTDWISFTPTGSWSNTTYSGLYKRVGDDVLIKYKLLLTGTPSGLLSLELPNSLIVDENKVVTTGVSNYVGYGNAIETGASSYHIASRYRTDNDNIDVVYWNSSTGLTAALGATGLFTFGNTDEITIEMRLPIQGWSTGRTEVVNQQTELTAETANELSAIINMSTDTVTSSNYDWIDSVSTPVTGDLQIDISSLGLTQVPSCTCIDTQSGANTPVDCVDDQDNPNTTSTLYFALIQGNGNGVDINNVQINCSKQGTDVNKSIELLGKFKLKKCQKKYLTSDITATTADVTDLKFENLDTSKTYEMTGRLRFVFSGTTNCSINVSDGTNNVLGLFDALSDTVPPTDRKQYPLSSSTFTPSSNTLTTTLTESGTCTFEGDGTVGETYLELCEYQSMVVSETSEW